MAGPGTCGNKQLAALWYLDPRQAENIVIKALDDYKGDVQRTAWALSLGRTTLTRWIQEHERIKSQLEKIRKKYSVRMYGRPKAVTP